MSKPLLKSWFARVLAVAVAAAMMPALARDASDTPIVPPKMQPGEAKIRIDGRMDEAAWEQVPFFDNLVIIDPDTLDQAPEETRVKFFYTDRGMYVGVWAQQDPSTLVSRLSSRDQFLQRDDFSLTLDPSGEGLYGYWFNVTLGNSVLDGTVLPERQFSNQWDGPWNGASAKLDDGWSLEMFLPWSMMTMPQRNGDKREMGFYLSRQVAYKNERWGFPALPFSRPVFMSALQKLEFEGVSPRQQFTFYPFAAATWDHEMPGSEDSYKAGFDVFWRPSTNLQLTATVNPDFGNVESDNVVVNLSAFETFFPEKRAFFLEGSEIFKATPRAGTSRNRRGEPTTLVNTRRIGSRPIFPDVADFELTSIERNQPSELLGAGKVTGQSGRWRYGLMGAAENETVLNGTVNGAPVSVVQQGRDFGIARLLYEDTAGGGRRALGLLSTIVAHPQGDAQTNGIDFHWLNGSGRWNVDGQLLHSDVDDQVGYGGFVDVTWVPRDGLQHSFAFETFDDNIDINDFGFFRRNGSISGRYGLRIIESDVPGVKQRFTNIRVSQEYNTDGKVVRSGAFTSRDWFFNNNWFLEAELNYFPKRWDDINSEGNGAFRIDERFQTGFFFGTDESKRLWLGLGIFFRQEDIGGGTFEKVLNLTWRPVDRLALSMRMAHENSDGWLIHRDGRDFTTYESENWFPNIEAEFFLSARQQFRITAQWAGIKAFEEARWRVPVGDGDLEPVDFLPGDTRRDFSISRLTFQARYRWEIAPLSDLFLVYTRGSNVGSRPGDDFSELLRSSWTEPLVDVFVLKLRYRLGN